MTKYENLLFEHGRFHELTRKNHKKIGRPRTRALQKDPQRVCAEDIRLWMADHDLSTNKIALALQKKYGTVNNWACGYVPVPRKFETWVFYSTLPLIGYSFRGLPRQWAAPPAVTLNPLDPNFVDPRYDESED